MKTKLPKRGSLIKIDGQVCQLTANPTRAIDGTYLVFYRTSVGSRTERSYLTEQELTEITE